MSHGLGIAIVISCDRTKRDFANGLFHGWNIAHALPRSRRAAKNRDELAPSIKKTIGHDAIPI
jgi:hypothetical protein